MDFCFYLCNKLMRATTDCFFLQRCKSSSPKLVIDSHTFNDHSGRLHAVEQNWERKVGMPCSAWGSKDCFQGLVLCLALHNALSKPSSGLQSCQLCMVMLMLGTILIAISMEPSYSIPMHTVNKNTLQKQNNNFPPTASNSYSRQRTTQTKSCPSYAMNR